MGMAEEPRNLQGSDGFYNSFDTVVTVRSEEKGKRILEAHPNVPKEKLSYVIVKDVAQDGAFDEVRRLELPVSNTLILIVRHRLSSRPHRSTMSFTLLRLSTSTFKIP